MKKAMYCFLAIFMVLVLFIGCQEGSEVNNITEEGWSIPEGEFLVVLPEIEGFSGRSSSRAITADYHFEFAENEALKVYSAVGGSLDATITSTIPTEATSDPIKGNGQTATFTGAGFNLDPSAKYYSIYPAKASDAYSHIESGSVHTTTITRSFVGQTQTGNDSNAHLSDFDFNTANSAEKNGGVVFKYDRKVAFLTLKLTLPKAMTPNSVYIRAVDGSLVTGITETIKSNEAYPTFTNTTAKVLSINTAETGSVSSLTVHMVVGGGSSSAIRVGVVSGSEAYETVTSFSTGTFAANKHYTLSVNDKSVWGKFVTDGASLKAGMEAGGAYILGGDVSIENYIIIPEEKEVVLDLNGHVMNLKGWNIKLEEDNSLLLIEDSNPLSSHSDHELTLVKSRKGGIIYNSSTSIILNSGKLYMTGGTFMGSTLDKHRAIDLQNADGMNLSHVSFFNCSSDTEGSAIYVSSSGDGADFEITDCTFNNCSSGSDGGAIYVSSYGDGTDFEITDCTFSGCSADENGGAIYIGSNAANVEITDCTFSSCSATENGGAVYIDNNYTTPTIVGCVDDECTCDNDPQSVVWINYETYGDFNDWYFHINPEP